MCTKMANYSGVKIDSINAWALHLRAVLLADWRILVRWPAQEIRKHVEAINPFGSLDWALTVTASCKKMTIRKSMETLKILLANCEWSKILQIY